MEGDKTKYKGLISNGEQKIRSEASHFQGMKKINTHLRGDKLKYFKSLASTRDTDN